MTDTRATICTPLRTEQFAVSGARTPVRRTGMGPARSRAARPDGPVLVAGVAGGLGRGVKAGDVVVATAVRDEDGAVVACPSAPLLAGELRRLGLTVHLGPVLSRRRVGGADRAALAATGAIAVDTESFWLAPADGSPFAVVRVISDTAEQPLAHPGIVVRGARALATLRRAVPAMDAWAESLGPRGVMLASPRSFCAGVERAIDIVERALKRYGAPVYVRREIVHNAHVVADLKQRGAIFVTEADEVPGSAVLVLAAHGVAPAVRTEASRRHLRVIDATCPLVAKVHTEVRRYAARNDTIFLIGHAEHEEVEGTVGEAPGHVVVIPDVAAARTVTATHPERVAYAMQTTLAVDEADEIAEVLRGRFPALSAPRREDICYATTNRQRAVRAVAAGCDLMIVVGSTNSSNSLRLVEVAERDGVPAHLVDDAGQVDLSWLSGTKRIGITAGASAPPHLVEELVEAVGGLGEIDIEETTVAPEDVHFTLPKEVA